MIGIESTSVCAGNPLGNVTVNKSADIGVKVNVRITRKDRQVRDEDDHLNPKPVQKDRILEKKLG